MVDLERQQWQAIDSAISDALAEYRRMRSGLHISMLATTRGGKTTLATGGSWKPGKGILGHFENALVIDSTADPGMLSEYGKPLRKRGSIEGHRRLTVTDMSNESRLKIHNAMNRAYRQGDVAIYVDEIRQVASKEFLGLADDLNHIWFFGAKRRVSLIGGTQQPVWVPGPFYDQAKLHFLFHIRDVRRMKRLAEIGGDTETLTQVLPNLNRYEFAFVDLDGNVHVSRYELRPVEKRIEVKRSKVEPERKGFLDSLRTRR